MNTYEKKHKEEIIRATQLWECGDITRENLEYIFPELAESEEERIRKEIIDFIYDKTDTYELREKSNSWLAWLEKQNDKDNQVKLPTFTFDDILALQCCMETVKKVQEDKDLYEKLNDLHSRVYDAYHLEKQGEQKTADKVEAKFKVGDTMRTLQEANDGYTDGMPVVISIDNEYYHCTNELIAIKDQDDYEFPPINVKQKTADNIVPKFHEGDWVSNKLGESWHIDSIDTKNYQISDGKGNYNYFPISKQDEMHLWTIQDAKDGDIVVDKSDGTIGIFQSLGHHPDGGSYNDPSYCFLHCRYNDGYFYADFENGNTIDSDDVIPATKEQRDLLFQKIHDAGYEWNKEKKELRKIENFPILSNSSNIGKNWSEEDEKCIDNCCLLIGAADNCYEKTFKDDCIHYLQNLKKRMGI